ncbi:hypothetical protein Tco_1410483 [Tanacetum coccineum]
MRKTRYAILSYDQYAIFNGTEYAVLIFLNEYAVLDRKLDTPYPMKVDTLVPVQQIDTAYSEQLNTAYRSSDTVTKVDFSYLTFVLDFLYYCSSEQILLIFLPLSQIILISSEKIEEVMADIQTKTTMKEFATSDKANYYSGITSIMVNGKKAYELKGKFLDDLRDNAFSRTNGEDAMEHIEYFLKIIDPVNLPNVNYERLRLSVFLISLVGNASKWLDEFKGSTSSWVDLTEFFLENITRLLVLDFWNMSNDYERVADEEISDVNEANNDDEQETTKILRIETNLFDYETPLCTEFKEFNFLFKVDPELFTHDIEITKTYEDYENELSDELEEPWSKDGVPYEICDHICEPFRFKNGKAKWPTCNSNKDGFCNGGELLGMVRVGYMTYFQDYEWYNELADGNLNEEALKQKAIYEKSWGDARQNYWWKVNDHECSPFSDWRNYIQGPYANYYINFLDKEEHEDEERCELFDDQEWPVCNIRRLEMINYSFGDDEETSLETKSTKLVKYRSSGILYVCFSHAEYSRSWAGSCELTSSCFLVTPSWDELWRRHVYLVIPSPASENIILRNVGVDLFVIRIRNKAYGVRILNRCMVRIRSLYMIRIRSILRHLNSQFPTMSEFADPKIMSITKEQQQALDNALVLWEQRLKIGSCNYRLSTTFKPKEPTFQVALDIYPKLPGQHFVDPPFEEDILTFMRELGYSGTIKLHSNVKVEMLPQPWRTFSTIINKCLSGKDTRIDTLRLSRAQILWGLYHQENFDYVYLLWEELVYQIENKESMKNRYLYYPRFTKVIINHFTSQDQSIPRRNKVDWNMANDELLLTTMRFIP